MKFQRRGKSCKDTGVTLTGDEIVGSILRAGMSFLPIALSAHGRIGSLFRRFLYGIDPIEPPSFAKDRIHSPAAERLARSHRVPRALLERADLVWRCENPDKPYGEPYLALMPSRHFEQKFGLVISTAVSSHLLRAHNKIRSKPPVKCLVSDLCQCDDVSVPRSCGDS